MVDRLRVISLSCLTAGSMVDKLRVISLSLSCLTAGSMVDRLRVISLSLSCLTAGSMVDRLRVISLSLLSDCWVYGRQAEGDLRGKCEWSLSLV